MTVNKAMVSLATEGLILRNRRAGNAKVEERGAIHGYHALTDELRPPCCVHLGSEGHRLGRSRFIRSLHCSDALPVMLEDRHIFLDAAPDAERADFVAEPPGLWLVAHVAWTEAEHRMAAISADTASARALQITGTAPCLLVERRSWRGPDTVTIVRKVFRGDAFDLIARFGPLTDRDKDCLSQRNCTWSSIRSEQFRLDSCRTERQPCPVSLRRSLFFAQPVASFQDSVYSGRIGET